MLQLRLPFLAATLFLLFQISLQAQGSLEELYYSGEYTEIITQATQQLSSGDTAFNTYYLKTLSEIQTGQTLQAIKTLQDATDVHPGDLRFTRMLAGQYYEAGDYPKASVIYSSLIAADSSDISSWIKLAEIASFRQQYDKALDALKMALAFDPQILGSLMMMGDILQRQHNTGAVVFYKRAYQSHPHSQKAAYALGNWYVKHQRPAEALPICEHMLEIDSTSIKFQKLAGYANHKSNIPIAAIRHFDEAIKLGDSTAFSFKYKGISHYRLMDQSGAIEPLQLAMERDTNDAEVHYFLGSSLATTKKKDEAMYHLERSLQLIQPDPPVVYLIYSEQGNIKRLEGDYLQAYSLYQKAWEADTSNPMALYFMASILDNSLHRSKEALLDYQHFINQLDRMPEATNDNQYPSYRSIVEDRIIALKEELFFLDEK